MSTSYKVPKLGTIFNIGALCFDEHKNVIGACLDTPNAIAKACMEHSEIAFIKEFGDSKLKTVDYYRDRMRDWNTAISQYRDINGHT